MNDSGYIKYENDEIYGSYFKYIPTDFGYNLEQYSCTTGRGFDWWRADIKDNFHLTTTLYVSLNEFGQPIKKESIYAITGALKDRIEYYYQESAFNIKKNSLLFPTASCKIISELNPDFLYYEVSGRLVSSVSGSAYLIEKTTDGTNLVLLIEE